MRIVIVLGLRSNSVRKEMKVNQEITLNQLVDNFLVTTHRACTKAEAEQVSMALTTFSKTDQFITTAYNILTATECVKDKQTLLTSLFKDKFKFEYEAISPAKIQLHYRQLCELAHHIQVSNNAAFTNISLSLAYIYIHLIATGERSLQQFLAPFLPNQTGKFKLYNYYFKVLEYLASEVDNSKFVMDEQQRDVARARLISQQLTILSNLNESSGKAFEIQAISKEHILQCFEAWISVNYDKQVINSLPEHFLFKKVLELIRDDACSESACNCLKTIIYELKDSNENAPVYEALSAYTLEILYLVQRNINEMELAKAEDFMRVIVEFARKSIGLFISKYDKNIDQFLRKLVYHFQNSLLNIYQNMVEFFEEFLHEAEKIKTQTMSPVNPAIIQLTQTLYDGLCNKCQLPFSIIMDLNTCSQNKVKGGNLDTDDLFRDRDFTEDIFQDIAILLGKEHYLQYVYNKINALNSVADEKVLWPCLEVYLFSLIDAVREYPAIDQSAVEVVKVYLRLAADSQKIPICVRRGFLRVFRSMMTMKQKNLQFTYRVMCAIISCFQSDLLIGVAQKAFCRGCEENVSVAATIFKEFGPVLDKYPHRQHIVKGMMTLMCSSKQLISQYFLKTLTFLFSKFKLQSEQKGKQKQYMNVMIAAIKAFQVCPHKNECMPLLLQFTQQQWLYIKQVLSLPQRYKDDEDVNIERTIRILKNIMRTLGFQFAAFIKELFTIVLTAYQTYPICSYVYLVQVSVTIYSSDPNYTQYLKEMYSSFCDITYQHMAKIDSVNRFCYLLDDFIGMNKRFFVYNSSVVLESGKLPQILDLCMDKFLGCDLPRVAKAAYCYFETIFKVYWPPQLIDSYNQNHPDNKIEIKPENVEHYKSLKLYLLQKMENIIAKMLEHLNKAPPESTREYILDALLSGIKGFVQENNGIWNGLLDKLPSEILVIKEKERMKYLLQIFKTANLEEAKACVKSLDKMLVLINKRMTNADNRRTIVF